jgi:hypothetical protein
MSALETTVRVNSEKQTLILAGEPVPLRSTAQLAARGTASLQRPLTIVAMPVDEPMLIIDSTALPENFGGAINAANAYACTQGLSRARNAIIDTYA